MFLVQSKYNTYRIKRSINKPAGSATALLRISTTDPLRQKSNNVLAYVKILHLYLAAVDHVHNVINCYAVTQTKASQSLASRIIHSYRYILKLIKGTYC